MEKVTDFLNDKEQFADFVKRTMDAKALQGVQELKKEYAAEFIAKVEDE